LAILTNWGGTESVTVSFRGNYTVVDALANAPVEVTYEQGTTLATVKLSAGAVSVLRTGKVGK
jgi:hypothetical protein